jgi:hypothetical protein
MCAAAGHTHPPFKPHFFVLMATLAPLTPITAITRGLRARSPPADLLGPASSIIKLRKEATPGVCATVESVMRTAASPEEGSLSRDDCKDELALVVQELQRRSDRREDIKKISDERERLFKEAEQQLEDEKKQQVADLCASERAGMVEAQQALFEVRKGKRLRRDTLGRAHYV